MSSTYCFRSILGVTGSFDILEVSFKKLLEDGVTVPLFFTCGIGKPFISLGVVTGDKVGGMVVSRSSAARPPNPTSGDFTDIKDFFPLLYFFYSIITLANLSTLD